MSAQMKQFTDTTGGLWLRGELEDKATRDLCVPEIPSGFVDRVGKVTAMPSLICFTAE
jgi:multimeric flavodoxin WrbA